MFNRIADSPINIAYRAIASSCVVQCYGSLHSCYIPQHAQHGTHWLFSWMVALTIPAAWSSASELSFRHLPQLEWSDAQHSLSLLKVVSSAGLLGSGTVELEGDFIMPIYGQQHACFCTTTGGEDGETRKVAYAGQLLNHRYSISMVESWRNESAQMSQITPPSMSSGLVILVSEEDHGRSHSLRVSNLFPGA